MQKEENPKKRKAQPQTTEKKDKKKRSKEMIEKSTALMYNEKMLDHCGDTERPQRLVQIMSKLEEENILEKCKMVWRKIILFL